MKGFNPRPIISCIIKWPVTPVCRGGRMPEVRETSDSPPLLTPISSSVDLIADAWRQGSCLRLPVCHLEPSAHRMTYVCVEHWRYVPLFSRELRHLRYPYGLSQQNLPFIISTKTLPLSHCVCVTPPFNVFLLKYWANKAFWWKANFLLFATFFYIYTWQWLSTSNILLAVNNDARATQGSTESTGSLRPSANRNNCRRSDFRRPAMCYVGEVDKKVWN